MANTPEVHYVKMFEESLYHTAQQLSSRLYPWVTPKQMKGESKSVEALGHVELALVSGRHQDINEVLPEHKRRKLIAKRYSAAILVDTRDINQVLVDLDGEYRKALVQALYRKWDKIIADAAFATVMTGKDYDTSTSFSSDGGLSVDATAGTNYAKLREARANFINADVGIDPSSDIFFAFSGEEESAMLNLAEVINNDYSNQFVVDKGKLGTILGMKPIVFAKNSTTEPILSVASGERACIMAEKGAIEFGVENMMELDIAKLPNKTQTYKIELIFTGGAVRREGVKVQKFRTTSA